MAEAGAIMFANDFIASQQLVTAQQEFGKINHAVLITLLLVIQVKLDHLAREVIISFYLRGSEPLFLRIIDKPLHLARLKFFVIGAQAFKNAFYYRQLVG